MCTAVDLLGMSLCEGCACVRLAPLSLSYCFISEEVTNGREVGLPADNAMLLESRPALGNSETCYSDFGLTVRFLLRLYVASERG